MGFIIVGENVLEKICQFTNVCTVMYDMLAKCLEISCGYLDTSANVSTNSRLAIQNESL